MFSRSATQPERGRGQGGGPALRPEPAYDARLARDFAGIGPAMGQLRARLRPVVAHTRNPLDLLARLEGALVEVLNNVIEHACGADPEATIAVSVWFVDGALFAAIRDRGRPFSFAAIPAPADACGWEGGDGVPESIPERGFGWQIIRGTVDDLAYERFDEWNVLILELRV